jgi:hypothetical protein
MAENLDLVPDHKKELINIFSEKFHGYLWKNGNNRAELEIVLKDSPHIVYFYCHGGQIRGCPFLQFGPEKAKDNEIDFTFFKKVKWTSPQPLVFLNGCYTTNIDPNIPFDFVEPLVSASNCAGVIGTEITIFEDLATDFAEAFFTQFINKEKSVGESLRNARLELLSYGNPLGLVYIPFAIAGLKLEKNPAL